MPGQWLDDCTGRSPNPEHWMFDTLLRATARELIALAVAVVLVMLIVFILVQL